MHVTSPVQDWFKPLVSHCEGITTQTVVQHNYHNTIVTTIQQSRMCFVDDEVLATAHARVIMTVYPQAIGITLPWSSRLPAQL